MQRLESRRIAIACRICVIVGVALAAQQSLVGYFEYAAASRLLVGDVASARAAYEWATCFGGDRYRAAHALGVAAYRRGEFNVAADEFATVAGADDRNARATARFNRGNALVRAAEGFVDTDRNRATAMLGDAVAEYDRVIAEVPDAADARDNRQFADARLAAVRRAGRPEGAVGDQPQAAGAAEAAPVRRGGDDAARQSTGVAKAAEGVAAADAPVDALPPPGTPATLSRDTHRELSAAEAERILAMHRGRERVTGTLHGIRRLERSTKPERDW